MTKDRFGCLQVCTDAERGLLGAAVDPQFASNGYILYDHDRRWGVDDLTLPSATARYGRMRSRSISDELLSTCARQERADFPRAIPVGFYLGEGRALA